MKILVRKVSINISIRNLEFNKIFKLELNAHALLRIKLKIYRVCARCQYIICLYYI